MMMVQVKMGYN